MNGVTYDAGALIAADHNDRRMVGPPRRLARRRGLPQSSAAVLAEAWRGGSRQASLARFLALCSREPMSEQQAKSVGVLAGKADHDDIVDVAVVEGAIRRQDAIVTSNHSDIRKITDAVRAKITIERI